MAPLELTHLLAANGATAPAVAGGATVEAEAGAVTQPSSFNQLLQASTAAESEGGAPDIELPADWQVVLVTDQNEPGASSEPVVEIDIETDSDDDPDVTAGETLADMSWFGLPLVVEARAALRNVSASGAEPSLSAVTAAADSVDSTQLRSLLRLDEAFEDAAAHVSEPSPSMIGGTPAQTNPSSIALARPDGGATSAALPTTPDLLNLHQKNWERTLGCQLSWMVNNGLQEAEIKVNPPDLGPLEVRVSLRHDQTNVTFFSHDATVREAIETTLPRLREMLDSQGINLNQAQVSDQSLARQQAGAGEQSSYGQRDRRLPATTPGSDSVVDAVEPRPRSRNLRGMVDDYA